MIDICKMQLCYWAQVTAAGAFTNQNGLGGLTIAGPAASVFTITMPANFSIPKNRRVVVPIVNSAAAAAGGQAVYDDGASGALTILINTYTGPGVAADRGFTLLVYRVLDEIGAGVG
jgi:hypothetical protein